jgi:hypothetical protein
MRKYTLNEVAGLLTRMNPTRVYSAEKVWQWCQEGLRYEWIDNIRGVSYKPVLIAEEDLESFLEGKGYDVNHIFTD